MPSSILEILTHTIHRPQVLLHQYQYHIAAGAHTRWRARGWGGKASPVKHSQKQRAEVHLLHRPQVLSHPSRVV